MKKYAAIFSVATFTILALMIAIIFLALPTGAILGQSHNETLTEPMELLTYSLQSQVIGSGGGAASGGSYQLHGTIGQPATGVSQGGVYRLSSGFWRPLGVDFANYLPLILR